MKKNKNYSKRMIDIDQTYHENGSVTINISEDDFSRTEISILSQDVLFVKIGGKNIYIDYSTNELYVDVGNIIEG